MTAAFTLNVASRAAGENTRKTVVFYNFNNGHTGDAVLTAVDSGPNHLDATVTGPLAYSSDLPPSKGKPTSLNATGDYDSAAVADNPLLDLAGGFTLSAWAKPTGVPTNADAGNYIVTKDLTTGYGNCLVSYGIAYNADTGKFSGNISGSSDTNTPCVSVTSTDSFPLGQWHFLSMRYTYNANSKRAVLALFVDGVKEGHTVASNYPGVAYRDGQFLIGAANLGSGDHDYYRRNFVGYIDDVKITVP